MTTKKMIALALAMLMVLPLGACKQKDIVKLDPKDPVTIKIWHYYSNMQKTAFDTLVTEFNETVGREKGILVEAQNHGNVTELINSVMESAQNKVGSDPVPNIFAAYADTADQVDKLGMVANLETYLTPEEIGEYIPAYIDEGRLGAERVLKIFPTAKTTEVLAVNKTDWDKFAAATGATTDSLATIEGVTSVAEAYYNWTDSLTPDTKDDGKAFFGRDAMANYFIIGCKQLGVEIFSVDDNGKVTFQIDEAAMKRLWDCHYVPYLNGYLTAKGRFRSDDAKVGDLIAFVGSTTSVTFFPKAVVIDDAQSYDIEVLILPAPIFEGGEPYAVQQGAGMVVTKATPREEYASTLFLKWFTEAERNTRFSIMSCYLPVKTVANSLKLLDESIDRANNPAFTSAFRHSLEISLDTTKNHKLYTNRAFEGGTDARQVLEVSLSDKSAADFEQVQKLMREGMSRAEAVAKYNTQENFELWLSQLKHDLEATQKG